MQYLLNTVVVSMGQSANFLPERRKNVDIN